MVQNRLFCPMEHKFPAVNKKCPQNLLSKPVPLYMVGQLFDSQIFPGQGEKVSS